MFNQRGNATPKINYIGGAPMIWVRPDALTKMWYYVQGCNDEIGWLGTVTRYDDSNWVITDTLLFEQEVHATTCELTPEGLAKVAEEILMQPDGMEVYNSIRLWGHSHVNMGVSPSSQDEKQMETFKSTGVPWFIRVIANKRGEMEFSLYDFANGVTFTDVPWKILMNSSVVKDDIDAEIKAKVSKITYNRSTTGGATNQNNYGKGYHGWYDDYDEDYSYRSHRGSSNGKKGTWYNGVFYEDAVQDGDYKSSKHESGGRVVQLRQETEEDDEEDSGMTSEPAICQMAKDIVNDLGEGMVVYLADYGADDEEDVQLELVYCGYPLEVLNDTVVSDVLKYCRWYAYGAIGL